jgi:hypothetical protein
VKHPRLPLFVLVFFVLSAAAPAAQKVPISFADYHGYTGAANYVKAVAAAYPEITELIEIGKSALHKRPIYVLVISNMATGTTIEQHVKLTHMRNLEVKDIPRFKPYVGKPGQYIDGGMHGNEYTGSEVCLYIIDKLVSGYGMNPEITRLIDTKCFYINPVVNPDGVYNSVERELSQRGNSQSVSETVQGPVDLNGDGHLTQFRYKDPKGEYVIDDKDPRLMVRLTAGETTTKQRYAVVPETRNNETGIDVNRNFPEGWWTDDGLPGGTGTFPTSSPESQAIVEFAINHRNILMVQNFHTSGGFTYRVPGTAPDSVLAPKDIAFYDFVLGKKYLEIIGEPVPEAWQKPEQMADFKAKLRAASKNKYAVERGYEMPRGWIMGYSEERDQRYGYGMVIDWWFQQFGAYAVTTELWNPENDIPGFPKGEAQGAEARLEQERQQLKWQDTKYGGKLFIAWTPYKHPALGNGEIGGWIPKYRSNAWPGDPLLAVCEKHWQFELFRAGLLPEVVIADAKANVLYETNTANEARADVQGDQVTIRKGASKGKYKIIEVSAVIENKGKMATHVSRGAQLNGNREDGVWLIGEPGKISFLQGSAWTRLGILDGTMRLPGLGPAATAGGQRGGAGGAPPSVMMPLPGIPGMPGQRGMRGGGGGGPQQAGPRREVKWLVAVEGDAPLKVVVTSEKGGTAVKELAVK